MPSEPGSEALKEFGAEIVEPYPSLIESMRAVGYSLPAAVADIVDNSIAAGASTVWIQFQWQGEQSYFTLLDDGCGMSKDELVEALRPGTGNPLADRKEGDLGRFGLGLKTASFSQCRRLSVISRKKDCLSDYRTWDLDYVEESAAWQILRYLANPALEGLLDGKTSGTVVIWEKPDRIIYDQDLRLISEKKFLEFIRETEEHLAMVFHRFIETDRLSIRINGRTVEPWDPFLREIPGTQTFPAETLAGGEVKVIGYVLPFELKLSSELRKRAEGTNGWTAQQGFYIYRMDRMLVSGDWLHLFRKTEFARLARIMMDMEPSLDSAWQLDIRKSMAIPPRGFHDQLKIYAQGVRSAAIEVYRHRGKQKQRKSTGAGFEFAWIIEQQNGREIPRINRDHTLVRDVLDSLGPDKKKLRRLLSLLEMTLPTSVIAMSEVQQVDEPAAPVPEPEEDEVLDLMKAAYKKLRAEGLTRKKALEALYFIDPFPEYPHLVEHLEE